MARGAGGNRGGEVAAALLRALLESLPDPRRVSPPSNVSDPENLLTKATRLAVDEILQRCPSEVGMAIFSRLPIEATPARRGDAGTPGLGVPGAVLQIVDVARAIFNSWGIGDAKRKDGAVYVLAVQNRRHHLQVGQGLLVTLNGDARKAVLNSAVANLRGGDLNGAVLLVAKQIRFELSPYGRKIRRLKSIGLYLLFLGMLLFVGYEIRKRAERLRRDRESQAREREERLRSAWEKVSRLEGGCRGTTGGGSGFLAPCVVCIEPLTTIARDWVAELNLRSRGFLEVRQDANEATQILVRLSPLLQRKVLAYLGPSLQDLWKGTLEGCGAVADGVELFRCGHVLHDHCAARWLERQDSCPVCRLDAPRIVAIGALPAAFAAAQLIRHDSMAGLADSLDLTDSVHYTAQELASYTHYESGGDQAICDVASSGSGGWGGGDCDCGGGTTGDW